MWNIQALTPPVVDKTWDSVDKIEENQTHILEINKTRIIKILASQQKRDTTEFWRRQGDNIDIANYLSEE